MLYCLWSVLLVVSGQGLGGGTAGDEDFNDGVATQAVAAMDAAGHLASRVQAGDDVVAGIEHVAIEVHAQARVFDSE